MTYNLRRAFKSIIHPYRSVMGLLDMKADVLRRDMDRLINEKYAELTGQLTEQRHILNQLSDATKQVLDISRADHDNVPALRRQLWDVRVTKDYERVFTNTEPLITVRIATYNRSEQLVERAIKSVLAQTYHNFEVIVVGDHCTDDTEERIRALRDKRIKFINLPSRSRYPEDKYQRWLVAGSPGMNLGAYMAAGEWIAPLDDDDEFAPDHLEKLLALALSSKSEMVYGALEQVDLKTGKKVRIWSFPPEQGQFSFQGGLYMKLLDFFEYDQHSWVVREPGDWNLCRRMLEAGVRMAATEDVVGTVYMVPVHQK